MNDFNNDNLEDEADNLMRQGRYQDAVSAYEEISKSNPTDSWAKLGMASALECDGKVEDAEDILLSIKNKNDHALRFTQSFYLRRERYKEAEMCKDAIAVSDSFLSDENKDKLADFYFNQGRFLEAKIETLRLIKNGEEDNPSLLTKVAVCLRHENSLDKAMKYIEKAYDLESENTWILTEYAETLKAKGKIEEARELYLDVLDIDENDNWTKGRLATLEIENGNKEEAIELYEQIIENEKDNGWALIDLSQIILETDIERSEKLAFQALENSQNFPWAYTHLANIEKQKDNVPKAKEYLSKALEVSPRTVWIMHELAEVCKKLGQSEEAYTHIQHAKNEEPFNAATYAFEADFFRQDERFDEAIANLQRATDLDSEYVWAHRELAEIFALQGNQKDANKHYEIVLKLDPDDSSNNGLKSFLLKHDGKKHLTIPYLEKAISEDEEYYWAWKELIECHIQAKEFGEALKLSTRAVRLFTDSPLIALFHLDALRGNEKFTAATNFAYESIKNFPQSSQFFAILAELKIEEMDFELAEKAAKSALKYNDDINYKLLYIQTLRLNDNDKYKPLVFELLKTHENLPAIIYHMAARISEEDKKHDIALEWTKKGLSKFPDDSLLQIKHAELSLFLGLENPLQELYKLLEPPIENTSILPWHDIIPMLAKAGDIVSMNQAHAMNVASSGDSKINLAKAWLLMGEAFLICQKINDAKKALRKSLEYKEDLIPTRLMLGMLHEQLDEHKEAITHLQAVDDIVRQMPHDHEQELDHEMLQVQIARLNEKSGETELANKMWENLFENHGDKHNIQLSYYRFKLRTSMKEEQKLYENNLEELIVNESLSEKFSQTCLFHLSNHYLHSFQANKAINILDSKPALSFDNKLNFAQALIDIKEFNNAAKLLTSVKEEHESEISQPEHDCLIISTLLTNKNFEEAKSLSEEVYSKHYNNPDVQFLYSKTLTAFSEYDKALAILLPKHTVPSISKDRAFFTALLILEQKNIPMAFAYLGKFEDSQNTQTPIDRIIKNAWPESLGETDEIKEKDIYFLPPFPKAIEKINTALIREGHLEIAARIFLHQSEMIMHNKPYTAKEFIRQAIVLLKKTGNRKIALSLSLKIKAPWLFIKCLLP